MMPDILKQMGPKQLAFLKDVAGNLGQIKETNQKDEDEDIPDLVGTNFEEVAKK